jgi:hypothetical protein
MTYFEDESDYSFIETDEGGPALNMGWLSAGRPYSSGSISQELVRVLARLCRNGVNRTRGLHRCEFCSVGDSGWGPPTSASDEDGEFIVGGAEIRVTSKSGTTYAAPDMIIHYVTDHGYMPSREFLAALRDNR